MTFRKFDSQGYIAHSERLDRIKNWTIAGAVAFVLAGTGLTYYIATRPEAPPVEKRVQIVHSVTSTGHVIEDTIFGEESKDATSIDTVAESVQEELKPAEKDSVIFVDETEELVKKDTVLIVKKTDKRTYTKSDYIDIINDLLNEGKIPELHDYEAMNGRFMSPENKRFYTHCFKHMTRFSRAKERDCPSILMYSKVIRKLYPNAWRVNVNIAKNRNHPSRKRSWATLPMDNCGIKFK